LSAWVHTHTNFRVDTFETAHSEQQLQCSTQFIQSTLTQLKSSVDVVIQLQKNALTKVQQAKDGVFQMLTTAGILKTTIDASVEPLETEIHLTEADIEGWNIFLAVLINSIEQSVSVSEKCSEVVKEAL
jgi:hypothetical protein